MNRFATVIQRSCYAIRSSLAPAARRRVLEGICRRGTGIVGAMMILLSTPDVVWAHGAPLDRPVGWWDWNWDPVILLNLVVIVWLYARGWRTLRARRSGHDRAAPLHRAGRLDSPGRVALFTVGMLVMVVALVSPLDPLSEQLGSAHMVQHMVLMTVAAPLLVSAAPVLVCLTGLAPLGRRLAVRARQSVGGPVRHWLWNPLVVWSLYALVMWVWHAPVLYEAALRHAWVHDLQHLTFFLSACLFWRLLLDPMGRLQLRGGLAVLYLFTTTLHATVLGVFMTIAPTPWYSPYEGLTQWWGLTTLEDQQLAGLIMWMPACATYALVAIGVFIKALEDRDSHPDQRFLAEVVAS